MQLYKAPRSPSEFMVRCLTHSLVVVLFYWVLHKTDSGWFRGQRDKAASPAQALFSASPDVACGYSRVLHPEIHQYPTVAPLGQSMKVKDSPKATGLHFWQRFMARLYRQSKRRSPLVLKHPWTFKGELVCWIAELWPDKWLGRWWTSIIIIVFIPQGQVGLYSVGQKAKQQSPLTQSVVYLCLVFVCM